MVKTLVKLDVMQTRAFSAVTYRVRIEYAHGCNTSLYFSNLEAAIATLQSLVAEDSNLLQQSADHSIITKEKPCR